MEAWGRSVIVSGIALLAANCAGHREYLAPVSVGPQLWPTEQQYHVITSAYGSSRGRGDVHRGVDISAPRGAPVIAAAAGIVLEAGTANGYGRVVVVDHGDGYRTLYGHLLEISVARGKRVEAGQMIGRVGKSGNASGYHLHYEVHRGDQTVDPRLYLP